MDKNMMNWNYDFSQAPKDGRLILVHWTKEGNPRSGGYELTALVCWDDGEWDSDNRIAHKLLNTVHGDGDFSNAKMYYPNGWLEPVFKENL